jgi:tetratricopeptide (TPR) repeat protein
MPGLLADRIQPPDPELCFVMMPFAESFDAIYRLIQRVCKEQGLACVRADDDVEPGRITSKIYKVVANAGIMIVDMTGRNPNVFYEMGLAHAISDNVILLTQSSEDVPFDLRDFLHISYCNTFEGAEKLATDLSKVLTTITRSADAQQAKKRYLEVTMSEAVVKPVEKAPAITDSPEGENDLSLLHLRAEISRSHQDLARARLYLERAAVVARSGAKDANEVGNCAMEAEHCQFFELSEELYLLALAIDPDHVNNRQCYASFLLDHRMDLPTSYEKAKSILDGLENVPERQERTRALRAQLIASAPRGGGDMVAFDQIVDEMIANADKLTVVQALPLLSALQQAGRFVQFAQLIGGIRNGANAGSPWECDRILADCYASSSEPDLTDKAIDIYEQLINEGTDSSVGLKHNLATLYVQRDRFDKTGRAEQLWREAFAQSPEDKTIRKVFAQFLARHNKSKEAADVLEGRPLGR